MNSLLAGEKFLCRLRRPGRGLSANDGESENVLSQVAAIVITPTGDRTELEDARSS